MSNIIRDHHLVNKIQYTSPSQKEVFINDNKGIYYPLSSSAVQGWINAGNSIDPCDIELLRESKRSLLKTIRDNNFTLYVTHTKGSFPASRNAYSLLGSLVSGWNGAVTEDWRDIDYNMVPLTQEECKEVLKLIKEAQTPVYAKESAILEQINAITDYNELSDFDVQEAWNNN